MAEAILPDPPTERRKLCAMRAMERLGLWGEENLIATLAKRPQLRWLANEEGARWAVLGQLGRIGDPGTFEEAVAWALQNRPSPEQAGAHIRCLRAGERGRGKRPKLVGARDTRAQHVKAAGKRRRG